MAIRARVTVVRRRASRWPVEAFDPEYAITERLECLAVGLAVIAGWCGAAPLPGRPSRRVRVAEEGLGPSARLSEQLFRADRLDVRSA